MPPLGFFVDANLLATVKEYVGATVDIKEATQKARDWQHNRGFRQ